MRFRPRERLLRVHLLPWPPKALGLQGPSAGGMLARGQDCHLLLSRSRPQDWGHPVEHQLLSLCSMSSSFSVALGGLTCHHTP